MLVLLQNVKRKALGCCSILNAIELYKHYVIQNDGNQISATLNVNLHCRLHSEVSLNVFPPGQNQSPLFEIFFSMRYIENRTGFLQSDLKAIQKATAHS